MERPTVMKGRVVVMSCLAGLDGYLYDCYVLDLPNLGLELGHSDNRTTLKSYLQAGDATIVEVISRRAVSRRDVQQYIWHLTTDEDLFMIQLSGCIQHIRRSDWTDELH